MLKIPDYICLYGSQILINFICISQQNPISCFYVSLICIKIIRDKFFFFQSRNFSSILLNAISTLTSFKSHSSCYLLTIFVPLCFPSQIKLIFCFYPKSLITSHLILSAYRGYILLYYSIESVLWLLQICRKVYTSIYSFGYKFESRQSLFLYFSYHNYYHTMRYINLYNCILIHILLTACFNPVLILTVHFRFHYQCWIICFYVLVLKHANYWSANLLCAEFTCWF